MTELNNTVAELAVRAWIADLTARYCDRLDSYDLDGVVACFTSDARTDYGPGRGGEVVGHEAIRQRIGRGQAAFERTHHQLGHQSVVVEGADRASGVTAALTWHQRHSGERELLALRYVDRFALVDGEWLISARRVEVSIVEGFAGTDWYWWPRDPPLPGG